MNWRGFFLGLLVTAILFILASGQPVVAWSGECVGVVDGDTIEVMHDGRPERIRLHGIDCPESDQDFGTRATEFTSLMVFGKVVEVAPTGADKHGRPVAWVTVHGKSLNKELVRVGLAWWYRWFAPEDKELEALENEARKSRVGLWFHPSPVPPWNFRKPRKKKRE
ncbi:MAG: thermonuclease family protein [Deltaproteobacteria bacterium]|nr:thermonuclease family protein [Deltaproteobacteria bacterium]